MNSLPLLRTVTADPAVPTLKTPRKPEPGDAGAALWASLVGLLQENNGGGLPAPPLAAGGEGLPGDGKDLPPEILPAGGLPAMPGYPADAVDPVPGSPVADAAALSPAAHASREQPVLPTQVPVASGGGNPASSSFPFPEAPTHALPSRAVGVSAEGARQATLLTPEAAPAPERTALAAGDAEIRRLSSSNGEPGGHARGGLVEALRRRVLEPASGTTGDVGRRVTDGPAAQFAPGDKQDTRRSGPNARYSVPPPPVVSLQADTPVAAAAPETNATLDGKLLGGTAGGVTLSAAGTSPAPLSAAGVAAPPPAGSQVPVPTPVTATPVVMPAIDVPPGADGWGDALGDRVIMMAGQRLHTADIRLNPAELGPLRVQVSVDDGTVSVSFHAQHALTRDAIEQALPRLRDLLGDNGLALADASVSDQGAPRQETDDSREPGAYGSAPIDDRLSSAAETGSISARRIAASSLVDVFA